VESKALTIVEEKEGTGILCLVVARADAELISDAVACTHKLSGRLMSDLIRRIDDRSAGGTINRLGKSVGYIIFIREILLRTTLCFLIQRPSENLFFIAWHLVKSLSQRTSDAVESRSAHERDVSFRWK
jgi:hypothetical protein